MKNTIIILSLTLGFFVQGNAQKNIGDMQFPEGEVQHVVRAADIEWRPCPPNLPAGCQIAVLEGNPQSEGIFTARFRLSEPFYLQAHTHPKDERVTVLKGQVSVAFGVNTTREDARHFGPGDYYVNFKGAVHSVWADESTEIQITGLGPWEANLVEQPE